MTKRVQIVRHNTAAADLFNGLEGEITVDTTVKTLRIHDGVNPGGTALAKADMTNAALATASTDGAMPSAKFNEVNLNTADIAELFKHTRGFLSKSVAGGVDVTLTGAEAENVIFEFTGILTADIEVVFPVESWMIGVINNTTGAFTLKVRLSSEGDGLGPTITQGTSTILGSDGTAVQDLAPMNAHLAASNPHGITPALIAALAVANDLSDLNDAPTARTNLGLGTAAVENVQASGAGDLLREDGDGALLTSLLWPAGIVGCEIELGTDTDHDFDVNPGFLRDSTDSEALKITTAFGKQIDQYIAAGGTPGTPTGALGVADHFTASADITFTNGTSKITNTTNLFAGINIGDTVVFRGTTSNNLGFVVTAKASDNDITVSPAPTTESPASCSMQVLKENTFYYIFAVDVSGTVYIGIDNSATAANLLAHLSATVYGVVGYLQTTYNNSNILWVTGSSHDFLEYTILTTGTQFFHIPWASWYELYYVGGGAGGIASGSARGGGGGGGGGIIIFQRADITAGAVTIGAGGGVGAGGGDTVFNGWAASGGGTGSGTSGGAEGYFGLVTALTSGKNLWGAGNPNYRGQGNGGDGSVSGTAEPGMGSKLGGGGGGGGTNTGTAGLGGVGHYFGNNGGNGGFSSSAAPGNGTFPGGGGGGGTSTFNSGTGAQGMLRVRAFRGHPMRTNILT